MVSEDSGSSGQDSKTLERASEWTERLGVMEKYGKYWESPYSVAIFLLCLLCHHLSCLSKREMLAGWFGSD
jgi:hypothetical protein